VEAAGVEDTGGGLAATEEDVGTEADDVGRISGRAPREAPDVVVAGLPAEELLDGTALAPSVTVTYSTIVVCT
jgi:hypothetical protein